VPAGKKGGYKHIDNGGLSKENSFDVLPDSFGKFGDGL